jgi:hypothetical protein
MLNTTGIGQGTAIDREDILAHAYAQCRSNKGAPGVDGSRPSRCGRRGAGESPP